MSNFKDGWTVTVLCRDCPLDITLIIENTPNSNCETVQVHGATSVTGSAVNFNPYQQPGQTNTYYNRPGWIGSPNAGAYLKPIARKNGTYKVEVLRNNNLIATNTFPWIGMSIFHLPSAPSGIVPGDTIRIRISFT